MAAIKRLRKDWKETKTLVTQRIAGSRSAAGYFEGMNPGDARKVKAALKTFRTGFTSMLDNLQDAFENKDDKQTRVCARQCLQICLKYKQATKAVAKDKSNADDPMQSHLKTISTALAILIKSGIEAKVKF